MSFTQGKEDGATKDVAVEDVSSYDEAMENVEGTEEDEGPTVIFAQVLYSLPLYMNAASPCNFVDCGDLSSSEWLRDLANFVSAKDDISDEDVDPIVDSSTPHAIAEDSITGNAVPKDDACKVLVAPIMSEQDFRDNYNKQNWCGITLQESGCPIL